MSYDLFLAPEAHAVRRVIDDLGATPVLLKADRSPPPGLAYQRASNCAVSALIAGALSTQ